MTSASPVPWAEGEMIGYDLETTGVDVETDRVVSAVVVHVVPGVESRVREWLVDPGVEIPTTASEVHGITTERARAQGVSPGVALAEIHEALNRLWRPGVPLVGHNPMYDLTLTDRELGRHLGRGLEIAGPVVDTLTVDRQCWRYVKGKGMRRLAPTHERYELGPLTDAHDARADALAALRLAWAMSRRFPEAVGLVPLAELHERQREWYARWARGFASHLAREATKLERGVRFGHRSVIASVLGADVEPTTENAVAAMADLRARRAEVLATATDWPMRPRPEVDAVA